MRPIVFICAHFKRLVTCAGRAPIALDDGRLEKSYFLTAKARRYGLLPYDTSVSPAQVQIMTSCRRVSTVTPTSSYVSHCCIHRAVATHTVLLGACISQPLAHCFVDTIFVSYNTR